MNWLLAVRRAQRARELCGPGFGGAYSHAQRKLWGPSQAPCGRCAAGRGTTAPTTAARATATGTRPTTATTTWVFVWCAATSPGSAPAPSRWGGKGGNAHRSRPLRRAPGPWNGAGGSRPGAGRGAYRNGPRLGCLHPGTAHLLRGAHAHGVSPHAAAMRHAAGPLLRQPPINRPSSPVNPLTC